MFITRAQKANREPSRRAARRGSGTGRARLRTVSAIAGWTMVVLLFVTSPSAASAWSQQRFPTPPNSLHDPLSGVSCTSRDACTAAGTPDASAYAPGAADVFDRWNGQDWSFQPAAPVTMDPAISPVPSYPDVSSISCVSSTSCFAVGTGFYDGYQYATFERWDGLAWSFQSPASEFQSGELWTVSCASRVACMAVGDNNLDGSPLVARWNGRAWYGLPVHFRPIGVSCFSRTICAYVGDSLSTIGTVTSCPILGFWTNGRWSQDLTLRCATRATDSFARLESVSCASVLACTAVGSAAYGWNGQRWTVEPNALRGDELLRSVSCVSRAACVGVGRRRAGNTTYALVKRWNGSRWSTVYVSKLVDSELNSVSCTSATACVAVGTYFDFAYPGSAALVVSNG